MKTRSIIFSSVGLVLASTWIGCSDEVARHHPAPQKVEPRISVEKMQVNGLWNFEARPEFEMTADYIKQGSEEKETVRANLRSEVLNYLIHILNMEPNENEFRPFGSIAVSVEEIYKSRVPGRKDSFYKVLDVAWGSDLSEESRKEKHRIWVEGDNRETQALLGSFSFKPPRSLSKVSKFLRGSSDNCRYQIAYSTDLKFLSSYSARLNINYHLRFHSKSRHKRNGQWVEICEYLLLDRAENPSRYSIDDPALLSIMALLDQQGILLVKDGKPMSELKVSFTLNGKKEYDPNNQKPQNTKPKSIVLKAK